MSSRGQPLKRTGVGESRIVKRDEDGLGASRRASRLVSRPRGDVRYHGPGLLIFRVLSKG